MGGEGCSHRCPHSFAVAPFCVSVAHTFVQDLERALSIEPENEAIIKQKTDLSQQFQDEEMELRVKQMVLDEEKRVKVSREVAARTALKTSSSSSSPSSASEEKKDDKEAAAKAWMEKSMEKIARGEQVSGRNSERARSRHTPAALGSAPSLLAPVARSEAPPLRVWLTLRGCSPSLLAPV